MMIQWSVHQYSGGKRAGLYGMLVCMVCCGVMGAGCSSLSDHSALPSGEAVSITIGEGQVRANYAAYPVMLENRGFLGESDIRLQADLLDVTGGGETVLASQEVDAGSLEPGENKTVTVEFRLIRLVDKDVDLRVTRIG